MYSPIHKEILFFCPQGLITDDLVSIEKGGNERKYLGVCKLPGASTKVGVLDSPKGFIVARGFSPLFC